MTMPYLQMTDRPPRLRLLGLVPLDFQAPAVQRTSIPLAVGSGDSRWLRDNLPCVTACPLATDVPRYVALTAAGQFTEAAAVVEADNLLPEVLCLVCPRPCETACRRGLIDAPVAIRQLKRAAVEFGQDATEDDTPAARPTGRRVALVGSGPAAMAAARELRSWGHGVSVYEAEALGGTLMTAIPEFRLPRAVIEARWQRLRTAGVEVHVPVRVGADVSLEALLADYDALLLATGCQLPVQLRLPGTELSGVFTGLEFMKAVGRDDPPPLGERVVVVGAGLVGLDCARSAVRLGARTVVVIEMLPGQRLPYDPAERAVAEEEGVEFLFEARVTRISGQAAVEGVEVELLDGDGNKLADAATQFRPADSLIVAIGQRTALPRLGDSELSARHDASDRGSLHPAGWPAGLFAAGDALSGPSSVAEAIAGGRDAAAAIHTYLVGTPPPVSANRDRVAVPAWTAATLVRRTYGGDDYARLPRQPETSREVLADGSRRVAEVSYSAEAAQREAQRCLQCQLNLVFDADDCLLCGRCVGICPYGCLSLVDQECIASIDGDDAAPALAAAARWPDGAALVLDETACIRCGLCVNRCPNGCLSLEPLSAAPISVGLERLAAVG